MTVDPAQIHRAAALLEWRLTAENAYTRTERAEGPDGREYRRVRSHFTGLVAYEARVAGRWLSLGVVATQEE